MGYYMKKVEAKMKYKLTKLDHAKLPSGAYVRWKNYAMWERKNMVDDGLLKKDSPRGIWEITNKGKTHVIKSKNDGCTENLSDMERYSGDLKT